MRPAEPVPITGIGCICSAGHTLDEAMASMFRGERRFGPPSRFRHPLTTDCPVFAVADGFFVPERFSEPVHVRTVQLALTAAAEALDDAGLDRNYLTKKRVGVCIGTNVGGSVSNQAILGEDEDAPVPSLTPDQRFRAANPAVFMAREFSLSGPIQTIATACSAGTDAIGLAALWIQSGLCDLVIAGGADELYEITYNGFYSLMNSHDGPCRPFDIHRKGLNLGEGAAVMILESKDALGRRGGRARARVLGHGATSDAFHLTSPSPDGKGLRGAVEEAIRTAGIPPSAIAFINAHGTGTPDNDRIEAELFNDTFPGAPFLSTKGYTGHTLGAAGAVEAAFTVAALEGGRIPASAGFETPDPDLPAHPASEPTAIHGSAALSETLAFGGNNSALIFGLEGTVSP